MSHSLSVRQQLLLCFIDAYTHQQGRPPTYREMAEWTGCKMVNQAEHHVFQLKKGGYLKHTPFTSRSVRLTDAGKAIAARWELVSVPAPQTRRKAGAA